MNDIYLMIDEKRNHALCKVGFASHLAQRIYSYTTHNPEVKCISYVKTMEKSRHKVEIMFQEEVKKRGYDFVTAVIDGKATEWFIVDYSDPFFAELMEKGLNAFSCGKNRKNYGCYILQK